MAKLPDAIDKSISNFLKNTGAIRPEQYYQSVMLSTKSQQGIVANLVERGVISEQSIQEKISQQHGLQKIEINNGMFSSRPFADKITNEFILKNRVVPFQDNGNSVSIAIADVDALANVKKLKGMLGKEVETYVAPIFAFEQCINALTPFSSNSNAPAPNKPPTPNKGPAAKQTEAYQEAESAIIDFVNSIIKRAVTAKASDIHIEAYKETYRLRFRIDGVLKEMEEYSDFLSANYSAVIARIKILSSLDISERRLPQDGGMAFYLDEKKIDIRISILPIKHGERAVLRIMNHDVANLTLEELGMTPENLARLKKVSYAPQGMILVTGPTGSGKSTTLYSIIKERNAPDVNILTVEDPVEYDLDGVGQVAVKESIGLTFSSALRSFLRQDPEIIMVGEIRDTETSDIAIKASLTGHLVLSTLHTNDAASTITRLRNMGVPSYLLCSSLSLIVAQRLVRVNCEKCKVLDEDQSPHRLMAIGFTEEKAAQTKIHTCKGCRACYGTGVHGRKAIHEVMVINNAIRDAVLENASESTLREVARKDGFVTMYEKGRELVEQGIISIREFQRVLMSE